MTVIAIDYTPAIRQQAGIGRIIRGQIDTLIRRGLDDDIRLFVAGPVDDVEQRATGDDGAECRRDHEPRDARDDTAREPREETPLRAAGGSS